MAIKVMMCFDDQNNLNFLIWNWSPMTTWTRIGVDLGLVPCGHLSFSQCANQISIPKRSLGKQFDCWNGSWNSIIKSRQKKTFICLFGVEFQLLSQLKPRSTLFNFYKKFKPSKFKPNLDNHILTIWGFY
jgi:hypothetical protein